MGGLLSLSRAIDAVNEKVGRLADWAVLLACLISAGNASIRYLFSISSNAFLEIQWYLFAVTVLLGASYTMKMNEHVRVDLIYGSVSDRARLWIDAFGIVVFLLPVTIFLTYLCWPFFTVSFLGNELSQNAGGLILWPAKLLLPLGFFLLTLQGISELIKRIGGILGVIEVDLKYEKPLQ